MLMATAPAVALVLGGSSTMTMAAVVNTVDTPKPGMMLAPKP